MLMLRKACQPLLNSVGLNDLHVEIKDKRLAIVGGCGKTIISISGIALPNMKVSQEDREYAVELFTEFLEKYTSDLLTFVEKSKEVSQIKLPELSAHLYDNGSSVSVTHELRSVASISKDRVQIGISLPMDEHKAFTNLVYESVPEAVAYLTEKERIGKITESLNKIRSQLATCTI